MSKLDDEFGVVRTCFVPQGEVETLRQLLVQGEISPRAFEYLHPKLETRSLTLKLVPPAEDWMMLDAQPLDEMEHH